VGGGSINATYRLITKDNRQWFCKINDSSPFPDFFEKERKGLERLRREEICRIPAVVAHETSGGTQVLILEWIDQGPVTGDFWSSFGEQLARLHRVSSASYGWEVDNYIGSLPQQNTHLPAKDGQSPPYYQHDQSQHPSHQHPTFQEQSQLQVRPPITMWTDFFIRCRLEPQIRLASTKGLLPAAALRQFERLYTALPAIFPEEAPSLLHGDLWSGNFLCDEHSQPVLIDPAVYFGHRSMDLAMTTLFGGFEPAFYDAYHYHFPFPPNYREQWEIANLYPLLVHLNLFGKSYLGNILHTIQRF
jgi:fructosamine-3-kinase